MSFSDQTPPSERLPVNPELAETVNFIAMLLGYIMLGPVVLAIAWAIGLWIESIWNVWCYRARRREEQRIRREREWHARMKNRREREENERLLLHRTTISPDHTDTSPLEQTLAFEAEAYLKEQTQ